MEETVGIGTTESAMMRGALSQLAVFALIAIFSFLLVIGVPVILASRVVRARESTREDERACDGAAGQSRRRRDHCAHDDGKNTRGGDGKRERSYDDDGASGSIVRYNGRQLQFSDEETQSLLFSSNPRATASGNVEDPSGSRRHVQQLSSFEIDPTRHKIFFSHSRGQKDFVDQLCVDLEGRGYLFPFLDERHHSLPKGKDFAPLIKQAARLCHVAVIVLSEEFLSSKWPMIELAEFHAAKHGGNKGMSMLPLFYKLSVGDLDDRSIEDRWMPKWNELASKDQRIDVSEWVAAVRALRRVNGLLFGKNLNSEVGYRKEIVQSIWKLSPGDLLYDSAREMVGYHRICQRVSNQFVDGSWVGASMLGLYETSGFGKTTLSKALCDYFAGEFMGRVCHVELGARTRMRRQELMLKTLCGIEEDVLNRLMDDRKGLKLMRDCMKWEPVFLVIDNLTNEMSVRKEAHEYLTVGFHPKSKIMITARSKAVLQDLLPGVKFCMRIPKLNEEEAGMIFLRSAAPTKCFSLLTDEERTVLGLCIQKCRLEIINAEYVDKGENPDNSILRGVPRYGAYHPLALSALGDFFYRFSRNTGMLLWKDGLKENNDLMRDVLQSPSITSIIGLQFSTLRSSEQLLFLDIAFCKIRKYSKSYKDTIFEADFQYWVEWLSALHGETASVIERRLRDLKRSGMIDWRDEDAEIFNFKVHSLYEEFAVWYVTEHGMTGLKNVMGVFQPCGTSLGSDRLGSKCISDLVRLRVFRSTRSNIWALSKKRMQELQNLVLLQIYRCTNVRELSLEGLDSLRHLELVGLSELVEVTLTGSSGSQEDGGILESLQYVVLENLHSLTHVPDFRSCTSLHYLMITYCQKVTNFEGLECPLVRVLWLDGLALHQLGRLPNFGSLDCLKELTILLDVGVDIFDAMDVHVNSYILKQGRPAEGAVHQGPEDSDEFSANSDTEVEYIDVIEVRTVINMHLENHSEKRGLSVLQKVLSDAQQLDTRLSSFECVPWLWWHLNEDDKEVLRLWGSREERRLVEWRFKAPEEYDD